MHRQTMADRKRQVVRDELVETALHLLAQRDYAEVTVDEIAQAAGVSRRTFFRYFGSKEDVIVEFLRDLGLKVADELTDRPAAEQAGTALATACAEVVGRACDEHPAKTLRLAALVLETPGLRARYLMRQDEWRIAWANALTARGVPDEDAVVAAASAVAAFDIAIRRWIAGQGTTPPREEVARAFSAFARPW